MKYALTNGAILDGTLSMRPLRGKTVMVNNGIIEEIVDCDRANLKGCTIVDMRNGYLMPGLINLCVHLSSSGYVSAKRKPLTKERIKQITSNPILTFIEQNKAAIRAKTELLSGVTTICTEDGIPGWDSMLRDKIDAGKKPGPRILISGASEHSDGQPFGSAVSEIKGKKSAYVTTFSSLFPYGHFDVHTTGLSNEDKEKSNMIFNTSVKQIKTCLENKSTVGVATGAGNDFVPHYAMYCELILLHKFCGMSNLELIHTATEVNARIAGLGDTVGRIAEGLDADLIVSKKNPLEDLNALNDLVLVMAKGRLYQKTSYYIFPEIDAMWQPHLMF
jgi:imidazolonepropionase-like amidohydrolase